MAHFSRFAAHWNHEEIGVMAFASEHWASLAAFGWLSFTALGVTMPEARPHSLDDFYRWFYDAVHQFANLKSQRTPPIK
jgi:hypothetical protein